VYEKYLQLARDANSSGDRVMAESYLQHAEHYYRIIQSLGPPPASQQPAQIAQNGQPQPNANGNGNGGQHPGQPQQPYAQQQQPGGSGPQFGFADQQEREDAEEAEI
jgi:hypothetical protein